MYTPTNRNRKGTHQLYSELDNKVFSSFCETFNGVQWIADYKDSEDVFCGIDLQLTALTRDNRQTYDVEIKSVHLFKWLDYCYFEPEKWLQLVRYENDTKLYIAIYPNHNRIAIWHVTGDLLRRCEKRIIPMKKNTANGSEIVDKQVYLLPLNDAKVFDFDLTSYKSKYNALHNKSEKLQETTKRQTATTYKFV